MVYKGLWEHCIYPVVLEPSQIDSIHPKPFIHDPPKKELTPEEELAEITLQELVQT